MAYNYSDFPKDVWAKIHRSIDEAHDKNLPKIAAFDADGTLWDNDAGNAFFNYEIENKLLDLPQDPWKFVYSLKDKKATDAFLWLAQIHKGLHIDTVKSWAKKACEQQQMEYFPAIKNLIDLLKKNSFEIYVVTASVKWAVEPCVERLGIPAENVLGFQTEIHDGIVTDKQAGYSTYREGKAEALLAHTHGKKPILSCGNTMGDFWLLDLASHIPLAVRSISDTIKFQDKDINNQELKLYEEALKKGWITHNFVEK